MHIPHLWACFVSVLIVLALTVAFVRAFGWPKNDTGLAVFVIGLAVLGVIVATQILFTEYFILGIGLYALTGGCFEILMELAG